MDMELVDGGKYFTGKIIIDHPPERKRKLVRQSSDVSLSPFFISLFYSTPSHVALVLLLFSYQG